jgi:hypothetical protein
MANGAWGESIVEIPARTATPNLDENAESNALRSAGQTTA